MALIPAHGRGNVDGSDGIADPQPRHGVLLRGGVHQNKPLPRLGERIQADEIPLVHKGTVHLVGDDIEVVLHADVDNLFQLFPIVHRARGIDRVIQQQRLGPLCNMALDIRRTYGEVMMGIARHRNGLCAGETDHLGIAGIAGHRQKHLVPWTAEALDRPVNQWFCPGADEDLPLVPPHMGPHGSL